MRTSIRRHNDQKTLKKKKNGESGPVATGEQLAGLISLPGKKGFSFPERM